MMSHCEDYVLFFNSCFISFIFLFIYNFCFIYFSFAFHFNSHHPFVLTAHRRIDFKTDDNDHEPHSLPEGLNASLPQSSSFSGGTTQITSNVGSSSTSTSTSSSTTNSQQSTIKRPASMYERRLQTNVTKTNADSRNTTSMYQMAAAENTNKSFTEEVNQKADIVTHRLKELIHSMQDPTHKETLIPCAERIRAAVLELINVFTTPVSG